ncbi:RHS repeat-associated core domain-containing protein [Peijinzhouia sedimentorum]
MVCNVPANRWNLQRLLTGIDRQNTLRTGLEGANLTGTSSLGLQPLWLALQLARQLEKAPVPESYLGYILYDQDSIRYDSGRVEISRNAFTNPEELALDITAIQGGFVEVYVYNGSASPVWYDQFSISSSQAVIIQENHYYPFGMQIAGLELDFDSKNRYLYNGKELQDDHDLDWHDYGARMYDAQIGRWHVVDPMADSYLSFSPYNYTLNNPLSNIDPNGMWVSTFQISQFLAQQTDPDRRSDEGSSFIQSVSRGFKNFFGKFLSGSESEGEVVDGGTLDEVVVTASRLNDGNSASPGDIGTGLSLLGEGMWLLGEKRSSSLYQQGFRRGLNGNYQLAGRNLSLFGNQSMTSATKPLTNLSTIGNFGKVLSNTGTFLSGASAVVDTYSYSQGNLSGVRYSYHMIGTGSSLAAMSYLGGPYGAAVGGLFFLGEKAWDMTQPMRDEISRQYWQFENALRSGWRPR